MLDWIQKKNPDLTKKELEEFKEFIEVMHDSNCGSFYGQEEVSALKWWIICGQGL